VCTLTKRSRQIVYPYDLPGLVRIGCACWRLKRELRQGYMQPNIHNSSRVIGTKGRRLRTGTVALLAAKMRPSYWSFYLPLTAHERITSRHPSLSGISAPPACAERPSAKYGTVNTGFASSPHHPSRPAHSTAETSLHRLTFSPSLKLQSSRSQSVERRDLHVPVPTCLTEHLVVRGSVA
jgi:hypothetical protein